MKQKMFLLLQYLLLLAGVLISAYLINQSMLNIKGRTVLLPNKWIQAIVIDRKDRVWVMSDYRVVMIDNMVATPIDVNKPSMWVTRIGIDENDQVWVVAGTGVIAADTPAAIYRFDGNNWVFQRKVSDAHPSSDELPCCQPRDDVSVTDAQFEEYSAFLEVGYGDRQMFLSDKQGNIWAGTNSGLVHFSKDFHIPASSLIAFHRFLSSGGYWLLAVFITILYSASLLYKYGSKDLLNSVKEIVRPPKEELKWLLLLMLTTALLGLLIGAAFVWDQGLYPLPAFGFTGGAIGGIAAGMIQAFSWRISKTIKIVLSISAVGILLSLITIYMLFVWIILLIPALIIFYLTISICAQLKKSPVNWSLFGLLLVIGVAISVTMVGLLSLFAAGFMAQ